MKLQPCIYALTALLCLIISTTMAQKPTLEWAKRFDGRESLHGVTDDRPVSVAVDAEGNTYVTGSSSVDIQSRTVTIKYSPTGEQLWVAQLEEYTVAKAIAVDKQGGVYVTGYGDISLLGSGYVTTRYDATNGQQTWVSLYHGEGSTYAIAVDTDGGVYVTGVSFKENTNDSYTTIRYDAATGKEQWVQQHIASDNDLSKAATIAVDDAGGVYVTGYGYTEEDFVTIRYNGSTGEETWSQNYGEKTVKFEWISAMVVDNAGGVYFTGYSLSAETDYDFLTLRYDAATGTRTWVSRYDEGTGFNNQFATAIAADNQGSIYVTGYSESPTLDDPSSFVTVRYDAATGAQIWNRHSFFGQPTAITADNQGGVYVTGYRTSFDFDEMDYANIRYDATTGEQTWAKQYNGPGNNSDNAVAIASDHQGGIIVTGYSYGSTNSYDFATIRYNATTGEEVWVQRYDGIVDTDDRPLSVAVDAQRNSYVTGTIQGIGHPRIATIKYSPTGEQLWVKVYEGDTYSKASAIAVDNLGGVYVTGSNYMLEAENLTPYEFVTIRFDAVTGEQVWVRRYDTENFDLEDAKAITLDNTGGVYVTGTSYDFSNFIKITTVRYEATTGEQTWAQQYSNGSATAIAVDNQGGLYITGSGTKDNSETGYLTLRYDAATGIQTWVQHYIGPDSGFDEALDIALDNQGGVYVTGYSYSESTFYDYATIRYDAATGEEAWTRRYNSGGSSYDRASAISVDMAGGIYITGSSGTDFATIRYNATTGEQAWAQRYDGEGGTVDEGRAIVVDNLGGVFVSGTSGGAYATLRYDAATGQMRWAERYNEGSNNDARAMAIDASGNVIVTGYSFGDETGYDFLTLKYSQQGLCPPLAQAPVFGFTTVSSGHSGATYSLSAPGTTSFAWSITAPDGSPYTAFTGQGTNAIKVDWPREPEAYKISVSYSSGEGCPGQTAVKYVHVYDPAAGFVTGGGWSDSPAYPEHELMQQAGRAYWAFGARYREKTKGSSAGDPVQGTLLLVLESGQAFRATSVEEGSLVIAGERAYFRGQGKLTRRSELGSIVTDERRFGFLVSATDGKLGKSHEQDRFRLMVWVINEDGSQREVVYDNQIGCPSPNLDDNAEACTVIEGGNIVIHKPKARYLARKHTAVSEADTPAPGLQVYPTAVTDRATVRFSVEGGGEYSLELYDMKGALVRKIASGTAEAGQVYEHSIAVEGMNNGLYHTRLITATETQTTKLVVQR